MKEGALFLVKILVFMGLFSSFSAAGILPLSRGGTGANLVPSSGSVVTSTSSTLQLTASLVMPTGGTVVLYPGSSTAQGTAPLYIKAGTTITTPEVGAFETDGTNLYWTNSSGTRKIIQLNHQ